MKNNSTSYPENIPLCDSVPRARARRLSELTRSARISLLTRGSVIALELCTYFFLGGMVLLLDSIAAVVDIVSTSLLLLCIRFAAMPPDQNHPFGHGRLEPLVGLQLSLFMILTGIGSAIFVARDLPSPIFFSPHPLQVVVPLVSSFILLQTRRYLLRIAKQENSPALRAEAAHFAIDAYSTLFAALVMIIASLYPSLAHELDLCGAVLLSSMMVVVGLFSAKDNLDQLMDRTPDQERFAVVFHAALAVEGVQATEKIRIQRYGPDAHVDIDIEVEPSLPVHAAHRISQRVRRSIQRAWPCVRDVTVHIEPYYPGDH